MKIILNMSYDCLLLKFFDQYIPSTEPNSSKTNVLNCPFTGEDTRLGGETPPLLLSMSPWKVENQYSVSHAILKLK